MARNCRRLLLGIDLGTTGLKAVVFDLEGAPLGTGVSQNEYVPGPRGWAEQDPRTWWAGCCRATHAALAQARADPAEVVGVGVCGFHHCPVLLSAGGEPTRPTIVTHDSRLGVSLQRLAQSGVLESLVARSGSRVMTGHFPPIYHHLLRNEPGAIAEARWILLSKDYVRFKLTGQIGTEICDATGTHLIAMPEQEWSPGLCELLQVPTAKLPPIGRPEQVAGCVTPEAAQATGLEAGTPVVYGGGDSHCALVGLGVVGAGEVGLLLGTNSTLRASFDGFARQLELSVWAQQHVVPGRFTVSASSMAGSSVLAWLRELCAWQGDSDSTESFRELESWAAGVPPGSDGLLFHPYLFGERSPFYNPEARGAFLGISHWHHRGHFVRAVMEGVAFSIANCYALIQAISRDRHQEPHAVRTGQGGGARLQVWRQIIADALETPLEVMSSAEPGCLGAALLAGVGASEYSDLPSAIRRAVRVESRTLPEAGVSALYRERRAVFDGTYRALEPLLYSSR
jgi:xylulokinase